MQSLQCNSQLVLNIFYVTSLCDIDTSENFFCHCSSRIPDLKINFLNKNNILRFLVKSGQQKNNFLISQPKHMFWVLKKRSQWDGSFEHPKHTLKVIGKKIFTIFVYLNLCLLVIQDVWFSRNINTCIQMEQISKQRKQWIFDPLLSSIVPPNYTFSTHKKSSSHELKNHHQNLFSLPSSSHVLLNKQMFNLLLMCNLFNFIIHLRPKRKYVCFTQSGYIQF